MSFANSRRDDRTDGFAYATLQATRQPTHSADALARAMDAPALVGNPWDR